MLDGFQVRVWPEPEPISVRPSPALDHGAPVQDFAPPSYCSAAVCQMATNMLGVTAIKPVERHGMEAVKFFLYDRETGAVMGRTPKSWALIILFYTVYYICLAAFWAAMIMVFFQTIDDKVHFKLIINEK